jgi:hypothetical protein
MTTPTAQCERFAASLIEGEKIAADPALAAHVGSCLDCFRIMTEQRDLPRIEAMLRSARPNDPGQAFWNSLSAEIVRAVEGSRLAPPVMDTARAPVRARPAWWARLLSWWRRPWPAALSGAMFATVAVLLVVRLNHEPIRRTSRSTSSSTSTSTSPAPAVEAKRQSSAAPGEPAEGDLPDGDLAELGAADLQALLHHLADTEPQEIKEFLGVGGGEALDDETDVTAAGRVATLDGAALQALARSLITSSL